jgi:biopolymer transport protein ExbB
MKHFVSLFLVLLPMRGFASEEEMTLDLMEVFQSCPIIYALLLLLSLISFVIWLYSLLTLKVSDLMPKEFMKQLRELFAEKKFDAALAACQQDQNFSANVMASGISARKHGPQVMIEAIRSEGRRCGMALWQRISLLNEIAVVSPMLGLLGTVVGLFFAFYDVNRSAESLASVFDGLGIAIGTTVVGLVVAILAMIFYTTLKFRVVNLLNAMENELLSLASMIDVDPQSPSTR